MLIFTKYTPVYLLLLMLLMLISAYSNSFHSPPVLDDFHSFINSSVSTEQWSLQKLWSLRETVFGWGRWIPLITFSWDIWYGQGELFFLHLTNFLIHVLCLFAVFFLAHVIPKYPKQNKIPTEFTPRAWEVGILVAGLWSLHPVQTNAVTYLVQRMASLLTLFYVLSVATYIVARSIHLQKGSLGTKSIVFYALSFLCMPLAFLSKENAAMLPVMLLCTEAWFFQPDIFQTIFKFGRKHWILSSACLALTFTVVSKILPVILSSYNIRHFTLLERLMTEARIIIWYISILLYPNPGRLSLEHDVVVSTSLLSPITTLLSIVSLIVLTAGIFMYRKRLPLITYGFLWFLLNLMIESSFVPLELVFEHRVYLPSVGFFLAIAGAFYNYSHFLVRKISVPDFRKVSWCVFALIAAFLTLATFARNDSWKDSLTLNQDNVLKAPNNPRAHSNLAVALVRSQRYEEAIQEAKIAIKLGKTYFEQYCVAANSIIISYMALGKNETAISEGERLLREQPAKSTVAAWPGISLNLAAAYLANNDVRSALQATRSALIHNSQISFKQPFYVDGAIHLLKTTLRRAREEGVTLDEDANIDLSHAQTDSQIAGILDQLGYRENAKQLLVRLAAANKQDEFGKRLLENILEEERLNRVQEAKKSFTQEYLYQPFSRFNACMAVAFLVQKKQLPSPFMHFGQFFLDCALQMNPDSAAAYLLKGWYHYQRNENEDAVTAARKALGLDPDYAKAWLGLGFFLIKANRAQEAVAAFQRSLDLYPASPDRRTITDIIASIRASQDPISKNEDISKGFDGPTKLLPKRLADQTSPCQIWSGPPVKLKVDVSRLRSTTAESTAEPA